MSLGDFQFIEKLGDGEFSSVFKVFRKVDNNFYALKKIKITELAQKEKQNALNEIRILASFQHKNIIGFKEAFLNQQANLLCLVIEYCDDGDLYKKIMFNVQEKLRFSEKFIWKVIVDITRALRELHKYNILHRDIKSANIYLTKSGVAKLGDMNLSKIGTDTMSYSQIGTPYYASPEVWNQQAYNQKSDIWSLGCIIYEMCTLRPPFRGKTLDQLYKTIQKGEYTRISKRYSEDLGILIQLLLNTEPIMRPSCDQILSLMCINERIKDYKFNQEIQRKPVDIIAMIPYTPNIKQLRTMLPKSQYIFLPTNRNEMKSVEAQTVTEYLYVNQINKRLEKQTEKEFSLYNRDTNSVYNNKPERRGIGIGTTTGQEKQIQTEDLGEIGIKTRSNTQADMYLMKFETLKSGATLEDDEDLIEEKSLRKSKKKNRIQTQSIRNYYQMNLKEIEEERQKEQLIIKNKSKEKQLEIEKSKFKIKQLQKQIHLQLKKQQQLDKMKTRSKLKQFEQEKVRRQLKLKQKLKEKELETLVQKQTIRQSITQLSKEKESRSISSGVLIRKFPKRKRSIFSTEKMSEKKKEQEIYYLEKIKQMEREREKEEKLKIKQSLQSERNRFNNNNEHRDLEKQRRRILEEKQQLQKIELQKQKELEQIEREINKISDTINVGPKNGKDSASSKKKNRLGLHDHSLSDLKSERKNFKSKKKMKTEAKHQDRGEINLRNLIELRKEKIKGIIGQSKLIHQALRQKDRINDHHLIKKLNFPILSTSE